MKKIKKIIIGALLIIPFLIASNAKAITSEEVFKRILVNNFQYCYTNALVSELSPNSYVGKQGSYVTLFNEGFRDLTSVGNHGLVIPALDDSYNKITHTANYDGPMNGARLISCNALIFGDEVTLNSLSGSMSGLFNIYNVNPPENNSNLDSINSFMGGKLIYNIDTEETAEWEYCYNIYVKKQTAAAQEEKVGTYCRNEDSFPISSGAVVFSSENDGYKTSAYLEYPDIDSSYDITPTLHIGVTDTTNEKKCYDIEDEDHINYRKCGASGSISVSKPTEGATINLPADPEWKRDVTIKITKQQSTGTTSRKITYKKDNSKWKEALAVITNNEYEDSYSFKDGDKYEFYMLYLSKYYKAGGVNIISNICQAEKPNVLVDKDNSKYYIWAKNKGWCLADLDNNKLNFSYNMTVFSTSERKKLDKIVKTAGELIELMGELDYDDPEQFPDPEPDPVDPDPSTVEPDPCYKNSGSLGWILCPVINAAAGVGQHMWNQIETYHMKIPASEVFKDGGGVQKGWRVVRDLANTVFVILFMVVIFSQLTGVGIDNYGIKKILPRLIVTAIILNLSYIICQIAVDLSNIFGMGLNNMFSEWASSIATPGNGGSIGGMWAAGGILAGIGTAGAVIWGFLNTGSIAGALVWIGLAVLGIVLIIVVAMLFLYITLVAREAGIVLLIVLAPIAIVCYILPNTEKIGKKWFDLLKALLLVYPICGAMIGGGQLAGAILSSIDNEGMRLAAAIIQVIPFFFVPAVLKNSLSLMGNIGAKLSSLGRNIGRRGSNFVQNGVKNSNRFKDWSQYQQNQTATRRAQRIKNRLDRRSGGNVANLTERQQDRLSKANELLKAEENRRQQARINADNANYTAAVAKQTLENDENALDTAQYNDQAVIIAEQTKRQNARVERQAEADVGVYALNGALAMSRARSRRSAQELKAYQDQYASYDQNALRQEISTAGTWLAQEGGSQRMSALLGALEANGMERDIFGVLRSHSTTLSGTGYEGVMQTLTASKNKVLKAYGKRGQGVEYTNFMTGTGANSLQGYIREKGKDFIDGLDDKALAEIASHTVGGQTGGAMSTDLLIEAAAKINSQDAIDQVDGMLRTRTDFSNNISGEQTTQFNDSTVTVLLSHAQSRAALEHAVDAAANDPNLVSKYSAHRKHTFNTAFRNGGSKPYMQ